MIKKDRTTALDRYLKVTIAHQIFVEDVGTFGARGQTARSRVGLADKKEADDAPEEELDKDFAWAILKVSSKI